MEEEIWKDISNEFNLTRYQVSDQGKIRNKKSGYVLKVKPKPSGYVQVTLTTTTTSKKLQTFHVHRLVAETFLQKVEDKEEVDHINRNRSDNRLCNLRWANRKEQMANSIKITKKKGTPVIQLTLNGEVIRRWKTIKEAEEQLKIPGGKIGVVCRGKRKSTGGYVWKFDREETLPGEVWKKYQTWEVSNMGRIRTKKGHITYGFNQGGGYVSFHDGKSKSTVVHVMVAKAFIPNPENLPVVNHKDGNKTNNKVENLEWTTYSGNAKHAHRMALIKRSKSLDISVEQYDLKGNYIQTFESLSQAGKELGFHHGVISKVCQGIFKQTHGYIFKFAEPEKKPVKRSYRKSAKIDHIDEKDNLIRSYGSPMEAGKALGVSPSNIHLVCKGKYKKTGGHRFRYRK